MLDQLNLEVFLTPRGIRLSNDEWRELRASQNQAFKQHVAFIQQADPRTRYFYLRQLAEFAQGQSNNSYWPFHSLAEATFTYPIDFQPDEFIWLMQSYGRPFRVPLHKILKLAQKYERTPALLAAIRDLVNRLESDNQLKQRSFFKLKSMVYDDILANCNDPWVVLARQNLKAVPAAEAKLWQILLFHCNRANSITPSRTWITHAQKLVKQIGSEQVTSHLSAWLVASSEGSIDPKRCRNRIDPAYRQMPKGLFWLAGLIRDPQLLPTLLEVIQTLYGSSPATITRPYTQALLWSIAQMPEPHNYQTLGYLRLSCAQHQAGKQINKALKRLAEADQLSMAQAQERCVANYANFSAVGAYEQRIEGYTIRVQIRNDRFLHAYFDAQGQPIKKLPEQIQASEDFKAFQRLQKLIQRDFKDQLWRIEQLYRSPLEWNFEEWRQRYLDHPLVGTIARRLIWRFQRADGSATDAIWHNDRLVTHADERLESCDELKVRLWHPLGVATEDVQAWRNWIKRHKVKQPFPQAEREVYILTDAERHTETYSNRFAGHILRKRDLQKACKKLRWQRTVLFDPNGVVSLLLPDGRFMISYWLDGVDVEEFGSGGVFTSDQVRFYQLPEERKGRHRVYYHDYNLQPMALEEVPELLFSEVMRDVYRLLESCPTQIDPTWQPQNNTRRAFNRLTHSVSSDNWLRGTEWLTTLEQLLPRLKIGSDCHLEGDFLVVKGKRGTYKISCKNGSVFMQPSNQYLCIVSARRELVPAQTASLLQAEQDYKLSMILSKAHLLANDHQITDPTILRQIEYASRNLNQRVV